MTRSLVALLSGFGLFLHGTVLAATTFYLDSQKCYWQNSGVVVQAGDELQITASGAVVWWKSLDKQQKAYCGPEGAGGPCTDPICCLAPGLPHVALVGKIGSGSPFYIGPSTTVTADRSGALYLAMNETAHCGGCADNEGYWTVTITVSSNCSFSIQPTAISYSASGGSTSVHIAATGTDCVWSVSIPSNCEWVAVSPTTGTGSATVTVTVTPNSGSTRSCNLVVAGKTLSVTQEGKKPSCSYTLILTTSVGGKIECNPKKASYDCKERVTLTAVPDRGYRFESWSGDLDTASATATLVMDDDKWVQANFVVDTSGDQREATGSLFSDLGTALGKVAGLLDWPELQQWAEGLCATTKQVNWEMLLTTAQLSALALQSAGQTLKLSALYDELARRKTFQERAQYMSQSGCDTLVAALQTVASAAVLIAMAGTGFAGPALGVALAAAAHFAAEVGTLFFKSILLTALQVDRRFDCFQYYHRTYSPVYESQGPDEDYVRFHANCCSEIGDVIYTSECKGKNAHLASCQLQVGGLFFWTSVTRTVTVSAAAAVERDNRLVVYLAIATKDSGFSLERSKGRYTIKISSEQTQWFSFEIGGYQTAAAKVLDIPWKIYYGWPKSITIGIEIGDCSRDIDLPFPKTGWQLKTK